MIRVDLENQEEPQSWGYCNKDGDIEAVVYEGEATCLAINSEYMFTVYTEDLVHLIKALQECKKFVDSKK